MKPWRNCVRGAIVDPADRILLVQFHTGVWATPGGGIDTGETHEQALRRELARIIHHAAGCDRRGAGISWRTSGSHSSFPPRKILAPLPGVRLDLPRAARSRSTSW